MHDSLAKLVLLCPPPVAPTAPGNEQSWLWYEKALRLEFPLSYKEFLSLYGHGIFAEWVWVVSPFHLATGSADHFTHFEGEMLYYYSSRREHFPDIPFDTLPALPGLIPFGGDCEANLLFFLADSRPSDWKVISYTREMIDYVVFDCDVPEFFRRWIEGEIDAICPWMANVDMEQRRVFRATGKKKTL